MAINPNDIKYTIDKANELNESLKKITQTLKDIAEAESLGKLGDKLEEYGKKLVAYQSVLDKQKKLNDEIADKESQINNSNKQALKDVIQNINDAINSRRKLGEEANKLSQLQSDYRQAELAGNSNLQQQLEAKINTQKAYVDKITQQNELYKEYLSDHQKLEALLGPEDAALVRQLIKQKSLNETYEDYLKNHKDEIELIKLTLTEEQQALAIKKAKNKLLLETVETLQKENYIIKTINATTRELSSLFGFTKLTLTGIVQEAFKLDKLYNEHAKQLGISYSQVEGMAEAYSLTGASAGTLASYGSDFAKTQKNVLEASTQLNDALGTAAFYSKERLQDQIFLTKELGLDVKAATAVQHLSIVSAKTNKQIVDSVNNQVIALGKQTGIYLDNRKVLADVAQVSGQLAAQYKNNPDLLAKAVIQAKQLGLTLEQTAKMGDKLLDFPGSIESELKAELLTGKALNLEQARYLTLMGDSAGAAKELMNNVGGLSEFQKLNVLQQRALAEAVGLQAGELADSLKTQELLNQTGDKSIEALNERRKLAIENGQIDQFYADLRRAGTSEEMIANQAQLAQQDKMNLLVDKLLEGLSQLAEPVLGLVDGFGKFVEMLGGAKTLISIIGGFIIGRMVFGFTMGIAKLLQMNALLAAQNAQLSVQRAIAMSMLPIQEAQALAAITTAEATTLGAATPFIIGGIAAVAGAVGLSMLGGGFSGGGGGISESNTMGNKPTEKPIVVETKIENKFQLNNRDLAYVSTSQQQTANTKMDRPV